MISLQGSRFFVCYDEESNGDIDYRVFTREKGKYKEITTSLTDGEKTELISDLIYCLNDLLSKQS